MATSVFGETAVYLAATEIDAASTPLSQFVAGSGGFDWRVDHLYVATDDPAPVTVTLQITSMTTDPVPLGTVSIPALSGTVAGVPAVDLIAAFPVLGDGLALNSFPTVSIGVPVAMTAGAHLWAFSLGGRL